MQITSFYFDPHKKSVMMMFSEAPNTNGNVNVPVAMEKHETIEQVEKAARHRVAEALEAAAKALREHHG